MFSSFMEQFEELLSDGDAISEFIDGLWGSKARAKQGWVEWGLKAAMKRAAKTVGGFIVEGIKTGDIEVTVGGAKMDYKGGGHQKQQRNKKGDSIGAGDKANKAKLGAKAKQQMKPRSEDEAGEL